MPPRDQGIYEFLVNLKVVFDTLKLLTKVYLTGVLKAYIGTSSFSPLKGIVNL